MTRNDSWQPRRVAFVGVMIATPHRAGMAPEADGVEGASEFMIMTALHLHWPHEKEKNEAAAHILSRTCVATSLIGNKRHVMRSMWRDRPFAARGVVRPVVCSNFSIMPVRMMDLDLAAAMPPAAFSVRRLC
eukprot:scaffold152654_cov32-Tisochrysis_lutea.AAC.2